MERVCVCVVFSDSSSLQNQSPFDFCSPSTPTQVQGPGLGPGTVPGPGQGLGQTDPFQLPKDSSSPFTDPTSMTLFNNNTGPVLSQIGFIGPVFSFCCLVVYFLYSENYIVNNSGVVLMQAWLSWVLLSHSHSSPCLWLNPWHLMAL